MSIPEERNLIPFPIKSQFEEAKETPVHPLGPAFAAFDEKIDLAWERFHQKQQKPDPKDEQGSLLILKVPITVN